jgi:alanyl-tRNA synthetase
MPHGVSADDLRKIASILLEKHECSVVALTSAQEGKPVLVVGVSKSAQARGLKAGALVKIGSSILGGGGGGKDDFAQGGGTDISKLADALAAITRAISGQ